MKKMMFIICTLICILLMACHSNESPKTYEEESQIQGISEMILYEEHGLILKIKAVKSIENSRKIFVLYMENHNEQEIISVSVNNIFLNGTYMISESEAFFLDPLGEQKSVMEEMSSLVYWEDIDAVESLEFHITIRDDNFEVIDDQDIIVEMPEPLVWAVDYESFKDAKAAEQILEDNEKVKITLIEWGRNLDNNYITAVVRIENKSDEIIPAMVSGISLNGTYFKGSDSVNFLETGQSCYGTYSILISEVEDEGITSINDVQLMILTDESQNTGSVSYAGGEWYPIELEEKGTNTQVFVEGEPIDTFEDIRISYIGQDETEWSSGGGYYEWKLAVVNESDENIKLSIVDVFADGLPKEEWQGDNYDQTIYMADSEVGAHSSRYVYISVSFEEMIPRPELSFKFQIRSMAGGAVISTSEEQITLTPDSQ